MALRACDYTILVLDLAEGLVTTLNLNEEEHGAMYLAIFFTSYTFLDDFFQGCMRCTECKWDDCIWKIGVEVGQCIFFMQFSLPGVTRALIIMMVFQVALKVAGTCWDSLIEKNSAESTGGKAEPGKAFFMGFLSLVFGMALGVLPLLFAEGSSFHEKWYECMVCAFLWSLRMLEQLVNDGETALVRCAFCVVALYIFGFICLNLGVALSWCSQEGDLPLFDRVYGVMLSLATLICILTCIFACARDHCAPAKAGEAAADGQVVGTPAV
ncbi:unnamed protein product [Durusdinium trenchii]|uniref:Uncharacterized protein n=2 Tax=Durusdinium trenchii TaxID=1381693 RepID=A0ABP0M2I5_9DINO